MMYRTVSSCPLAPSVKVKLINAGFHTAADLQDVRALRLCKEAGLTVEDAEEVLQTFHEGALVEQSVTALDLLQQEQSLGSIVTFCSELDAVLGGGIPLGRTTEICGVPGIGKTQLCMQLVVDVQIPACFGGLGGKAAFIDTEGSFVLQRVEDMAYAAVQHCTLLAEDEEQHRAMEDFTVEKILTGIFLMRCLDYVDLLAEIHLLPDFLLKHPEVQLVVIDSVAFPFRSDLEDLSRRTRLLGGLSQRLLQLAHQYNTAVVMTNQMTTKVSDGGSRLVPALGDGWGHAATQRLILHWDGAQRFASLHKSPSYRDATVQYNINAEGFRDMSDDVLPPSSTENPSKRCRSQTTLS